MSFTTSLSTKVEQFNFVNIFKRSEEATSNSSIAPVVIREQSTEIDDLVNWINNTSILNVVEATTLPIGKFFKDDRLVIRFQLVQAYQSNFGLLRGLFAFQRPQHLTVSSIFSDRVFEQQIATSEVGTTTRYLEEILGSIERELKFKESLKVVIDFEQRVRKEQTKHYSALMSSVIFL